MKIHKEGYKILIALVVALVFVNMIFAFFFPQTPYLRESLLAVSIVLFLLILQFFRSPSVKTSIDDKLVFAPADGKIVTIEKTREEEYFKEDRIQISIFMSPLDVHVNRSPVSGIVKYFKYHSGKYLVAWHPKSSLENERTTIVVELNSGLKILMRQIAGAVARRIRWYIEEGQQVTQGNEIGFIKFGSRVDVFLPVNAKITSQIGDKSRAGKTVLAELV